MDRAPVPTIKVFCAEYRLDGIARPVVLGLEIVDNTLQGYAITVPLAEADSFRAALIDKFGRPTVSTETTLSWSWRSGTSAVFVRDSITRGHSMLMVMTKVAADHAAAEAKRQREQIKKGF